MTNSKIFRTDPTGLYAHWAVHKCSLIGLIFMSSKMPEFFEKSPLSGAEKHLVFQVTSCYQNVSTNVNFAYIESK